MNPSAKKNFIYSSIYQVLVLVLPLMFQEYLGPRISVYIRIQTQ